ncbi:hypothetical protein LTR66_012048, partial [Elasticomyces elasticus]
MNFAPYQSSPPESARAASPTSRSPTTSSKPPARNTSAAAYEDPWAAARGNALPPPAAYADEGYDDLEGGRGGGGDGGAAAGAIGAAGYGGRGLDVFDTALGFRMEIEACLAYLLLPPAGGVMLLLFEHRNDYVRFHAWQSSMLFTTVFILHLIFSWTKVISWILFVVDLGLIAWLTFHAYRD